MQPTNRAQSTRIRARRRLVAARRRIVKLIARPRHVSRAMFAHLLEYLR